MLGCSYFSGPDCLVVKAWIRGVMFPLFIQLTGMNLCVCVCKKNKISGEAGTSHLCIMAVINVAHPFVMTAHPSLYIRIILFSQLLL